MNNLAVFAMFFPALTSAAPQTRFVVCAMCIVCKYHFHDNCTSPLYDQLIQICHHRTNPDPICEASVSAYTNAFKAGNDAKTANLIAAKAFYQEFTAQATTNSNPNLGLEPSSCIKEAEEYARNAAAMIAFFKKAVAVDGNKKLSSVCDAATLAYIDALIDKQPNKKAKEAAADAYVRALTENPGGDPNGACFEAAQELL